MIVSTTNGKAVEKIQENNKKIFANIQYKILI